MIKVIVDQFVHSKQPPALVAQAAKELEKLLETRQLRARQKMPVNMVVWGHRLSLGCHKKGDVVTITKVTILKGKKTRRMIPKKEKGSQYQMKER